MVPFETAAPGTRRDMPLNANRSVLWSVRVSDAQIRVLAKVANPWDYNLLRVERDGALAV